MRIPRFRPVLAALAAMSAAVLAPAADMFVLIGTSNSGPGIGISLGHFNTDTGALTAPQLDVAAVQPAFFAIPPDGRHLYTVNSGWPGAISAYRIDPATAQLTLINQQPSGGDEPAYISLDQTGRFVLVANYNAGTIATFALRPDGGIGARTAFLQHTRRSVNPQRQTQAHPHSIIVDPTNRFVLVGDLGMDELFVYRFDAQTGALVPNDPAFAALPTGSGPRHVKFHPNGRWVYLINEKAGTVTAFHWDSARGALAEFQTISTLPANFSGANASAELLVHPNGRFLYGSNRGASTNSIAVFAVDQETGRLSSLQSVPTQGSTPRNFSFDPAGNWIVCANQDSNNLVVFRVDSTTGLLTPTGQPVSAPFPFCVRFLPVP